MQIKVKDIIWETWGAISYTIIFGDNEIPCFVMLQEIQIGERNNIDKIPKEVYKIAEDFGFMIQNKITKIIKKQLSRYEDVIISPINDQKKCPKTMNYISFVSDEVNWLVNADSLRLVV